MVEGEPLAADGRPIGGRAENGGNRGFSGAVKEARESDAKPEDATEGEIQDVAFTVWMTDHAADDVWRELTEVSE